MLTQQQVQFEATEARLRSEYAGLGEVSFPSDLINNAGEPMVATAMQDQVHEFQARKAALAGNQDVLQQRIAQYQAQIQGLTAQLPAFDQQLQSLTAERASLKDLVAKGLSTRTRMLDLDRRQSDLEGQKGQAQSNIQAARDAISELTQQITQLSKDQAEKVAADLRDVLSKLADVTPRLAAAKIALERTQVRTPYSGKVVDLAVFSVGEVVGKGERLLDVVPDNTSLDIEAKIRVEDISDVRPGMNAEVHFTSYKQRTLPIIHGVVAEVSADRLTDERTQVPYYLVQVDVNAEELAASPQIQLYPGMPAAVMITTQARTALDYLVGPLTAAFDRSFREK